MIISFSSYWHPRIVRKLQISSMKDWCNISLSNLEFTSAPLLHINKMWNVNIYYIEEFSTKNVNPYASMTLYWNFNRFTHLSSDIILQTIYKWYIGKGNIKNQEKHNQAENWM